MQVNVNKLHEKMLGSGLTPCRLAGLIYNSTSEFVEKLDNSNESYFTIDEMHAIYQVLHLTNKEACDIFSLK